MIRRIDEATKTILDDAFDTIEEKDKNVPQYQKLVYNFQGRKSSTIAKKNGRKTCCSFVNFILSRK